MDTAAITVNALTQASFTSMDMGAGNYMFTNTSTAGTSYLWDFGTGDTSTTDSPSYTFLAEGLVPVTLIANGVCNSDTITDTLNVIIGGFNTIESASMSVAPNPAHDLIRLISDGKISVITLTDILGNVIESRNAITSSEVFDLRQLNVGIYFFRVSNGSQTNVIRFVKE